MAKLIVPEKELLKKRKVNNDKLKKCPECHKVCFPAFGLKKEICNSCKTSD